MRWFCFALLMALIHPIAVEARPACTTDAARVEAYLAQNYGEHRIAVGLSHEGVIIEVFAKPDGSTWTLTVLRPDGSVCYLTSGRTWQRIPKPVEGADG